MDQPDREPNDGPRPAIALLGLAIALLFGLAIFAFISARDHFRAAPAATSPGPIGQ